MATKKQITKQMETSVKRIKEINRKIDRYRDRFEKNLAKTNRKFGLNIGVSDLVKEEHGNANYTWVEHSLPEDIRDIIGFKESYRITSTYHSMEENIRQRDAEQRNHQRLQSEWARLEMKAKEEANKPENATVTAFVPPGS